MLDIFDEPKHFDDWHYLAQLNQARSIGIAVEWWRSRWPVCAGSLYWQLNDCWPVTSWAAIDSGPVSGDARPKPLWFATRKSYAPRLLTIQPEGEALVLYALNDTNEEWSDKVLCSLQGFTGGLAAQQQMNFVAAPHSAHRVGEIGREIAVSNRPESELIVAQILGGGRATWFFDVDKNLEYPMPQFDSEIAHDGDTLRLTLTAKVLLRDVCIGADRLDANARVSEQIVTLLPGESFTWEIQTDGVLKQEELIAPPVFQCANRFGKSA
jgi:beta-mannosidase